MAPNSALVTGSELRVLVVSNPFLSGRQMEGRAGPGVLGSKGSLEEGSSSEESASVCQCRRPLSLILRRRVLAEVSGALGACLRVRAPSGLAGAWCWEPLEVS